MNDSERRAIAIVGVSAILPDAPDAATFWENVKQGRYSISEVPRERWDPELYWDPDPSVPDKTYSKIGGWVREWPWEPLAWKLPIPPKVADAMDVAHQWALGCARAAFLDCGHPERALDLERTAVVVGTAMAGDKHYLTSLRIFFPEYAQALEQAPSFQALPKQVQQAVLAEMQERMRARFPDITEDTMPGELANCMGGRIANLFDLHGPNFACDAACASALAAIDTAVEGLLDGEYDAALVGGVDRNMGPAPFVKFSKIGALSATGTRPYADGADGFVMGEGAVFFVLKRLAAAEQAGDRIYAVLRGIGGSSDGKGKGITAPNPVGQRLAVERAWRAAGLSPALAGMVEGHGTSTRVGDVVEVETLNGVFGSHGLAPGTIALGSVKSNIGHLKGAAGAAGLLKALFALHEKVVPPSLNFERPNPNLDFARSPFRVNTELKPWDPPPSGVRRAGVSAFGFGGTNYHAVLEEHVPGRLTRRGISVAVPDTVLSEAGAIELKAPPRGAVVLGAATVAALHERLARVAREAGAGRAPLPTPPAEADLRAPERLAIDYGDAAELATRAERAARALEADAPAAWRALRAQGVFRGRGPAPQLAFLYTGQGSQYVNMLRELREREPVVRATFDEADRVMAPVLGRPLSELVFCDPDDAAGVAEREAQLRRTEITQPAVLTVDTALTRLLASYGIAPDFVMGHSLGEYGALVAAGALPFDDALEAVSARGGEMANLSVDDPGRMAAVFAPLDRIEATIAGIESVVVANVNSTGQAVIGGPSAAVERAVAAFEAEGVQAVPLPVSHAFHTSIVAPVSAPLRRTLERLRVAPPSVPIVANVSGELYPMGPDAVPQMLELLAAQVASPVQFVKGLETLYAAGARIFVEVGPKRALHGFVNDVLGSRPDVVALFTNHPKVGERASMNQALCGLWAAGLGVGSAEATAAASELTASSRRPAAQPAAAAVAPALSAPGSALPADRYAELGRLFAEFLERGSRIVGAGPTAPAAAPVVSGAALGLPGGGRIFDDRNVQHVLDGEQGIDLIPTRLRHAILDKHVTRLVKSEQGDPHFETIESSADVIKLAARGGSLDVVSDFGVSTERDPALDQTTRLAIAAGIEALRDAGIPLVMKYRRTTKGTHLPERWMLPEALRDETGVIFASAFPGFDAFADELSRYFEAHGRETQIETLRGLRIRAAEAANGGSVLVDEIDRRLHEVESALAETPYRFDRRFLFRILPMAHAQFAEHVGARGPNTHVNSACASTTQAFALAEDWIRAGRCRRVIVVAADDVTTDRLMEWIGAGFLATGAAATDDVVEEAAVPFDRRRHGMILGMGAAGIVIESPACLAERGQRPICEVLGTVTANSAFHGTRLDVDHIADVMERVVSEAEARHGIDRRRIAPELLFVSHETYTPARGGSASAEVNALRRVFGDAADRIVVANTKGLTGHPMGVGIEDVVAIKALETGVVPPVPNYREPDPALGALNLSKGGAYPIRYALRLGAGFGSQISLSLLRWAPTPEGRRPAPDALGFRTRLADPSAWRSWLQRVSGDTEAEVEVVNRTLRVVDRGPGSREAVAAPPARVPSAPVGARAAEPVPERPAASVTPASAPAAPPAASAMPAPAPAASAGDDDAIRARVLAIVADKTGYPEEMLDLDLDLEADLGIDTVKQAETFAAIREAWDIPRDESLRLRDYPTLAHAIRFVKERMPGAPAPAAPEAAATATSAPAATSAASGALAPEAGDDAIRARVLAIVADKTGYPEEMLDLDLDLEADLGIDTVKQAETFAAIREAWSIPRDESLRLRDYPTLAHAIRFVKERMPGAPAQTAAEPDEAPASEAVEEAPRGTLFATLEADAEAGLRIPRRVPVAELRPPLEACVPTGVALASGHRVVLMPDRGGVGAALAERLASRGVEMLSLEGADDRDAVTTRIEAWLAEGPVHGLYWLPGLDPSGDPGELELAEWRAALALRAKLFHAAARALYGSLDGEGSFALAATRLGGRHGYEERGAEAPLGGAVTGFAKALARERPAALVKAVDFESACAPESVADALIEETLRDPGASEIGRQGARRFAIGLEQVETEAGEGLALGPESVFLVTGAAGGIVSRIVAALARAAGGGCFHLVDLAPEPDLADPDLARFERDRDGLMRELFERLRARGERGTPVQVERELAAIERAHAAALALASVHAAGGTAVYHAVDLTDADAAAKVGERVRSDHGRVDVVLHAAGLERSRQLPDKTPEEFDRVFDVKCDGWHNLLRGLDGVPIGALLAFTSIAGRFGNPGQTDYAAANDLLCKCCSALHRTRPETRALAIDWTAWGEIGMASRGSIPDVMARAGIDMLPPAAGVAVVVQELTRSARRGELLVAGRLGALEAERHPSGGLDTAALASGADGALLGEIVGMGVHGGLVVRTPLDPTAQPFLHDHEIEGTPVLPGVMGLEAFAEVATRLLPDWRVRSLEDVRFLAPFKFYRREPRTLEIVARFRAEGDELVARCALLGRRRLAGRAEEQETLHFTASVRLGAKPLARAKAAPAEALRGARVAAEDVYRVYFHGPAFQVLAGVSAEQGAVVGQLADNLPPAHQPEDAPLLTRPRLLELCFQTAGVAEIARTGQMGLPHQIDRVALPAVAAKAQPPFVCRVRDAAAQSGGVDAEVVDAAGRVHLRVGGYRTAALPGGVPEPLRAPLRAALEGDGA